MRIVLAFVLVSAIAAAVAATSSWGSPLPTAKSCPVFPADNAWNRRIDGLPVAAGSAATVAAIGATKTMHADFGSGLWDGGPIGIPITVVGKGQPKSTVRFEYADESDRGPYPIPAGVKIEGGAGSDGDRHALIVDRDACQLYELYALRRVGGRWTAGSGAIWNLRSNRSAPPAGRPPTLPGSRSCRASRATTRSRRAGSTTPSASPSRARVAPTSGPPGTSRARSPTRPCRRWERACG